MAWRAAVGLVLAWAVCAHAQVPAARTGRIALDALFPPAPSRAWETITGRPEIPDAHEYSRGLRASVARPTWWGRAAGAQLVLAHGVRLVRGRGSRDELSSECAALAEAAHARALATLR